MKAKKNTLWLKMAALVATLALLVAMPLGIAALEEPAEDGPDSSSTQVEEVAAVDEDEEETSEDESEEEFDEGDEPSEDVEAEEETSIQAAGAPVTLDGLDLGAYDSTSLQQAIDEIAADDGAGTITIDPLGFAMTSTVTIPADTNITLTGGELTKTGTGRHFTVLGTLTLADITITGAGLTGSDITGGIRVDGGTLNVADGAVIHNCRGLSYEGGGISAYDGSLTISGGEITGNMGQGGGLFAKNSEVYFSGGKVHGNSVPNNESGGGIYLMSGTMAMTGGKVYNNSAYWGAGVMVDVNAEFNMSSGEIYDNTGTAGAGVFANNATINLSGSAEIHDNTATGSNANVSGGGGIFLNNFGTLNMNGGKIYDNVASKAGGVGTYAGYVNINGGEIYSNKAAGYAGGIYAAYGGKIVMTDGAIYGNEGTLGGGVFTYTGIAMELRGGSITENRAVDSSANASGGGGIMVLGKLTMTGGIVAKNTAELGGGVYLYPGYGSLEMSGDAEISDNIATRYGGGVYAANASIAMTGGEISNNTSDGHGGGVYMNNATLVMEDGDISENSVAAGDYNGNYPYGGGVAAYNGSEVYVEGGKINGNVVLSGNAGAGVYVQDGYLEISGGVISGNTGTNGAVAVRDSDMLMTDGSITGNKNHDGTVGGYGGGFAAWSSTITMTGGDISHNTANYNGGGVILYSGTVMNMSGGSVNDNTSAGHAGGVEMVSGSELNLSGDAEIHGNTAEGDVSDGDGGGIYASFTTILTIVGDAKIYGNHAETGGGVYQYPNSSFTMNGGAIDDNVADEGAGVWLASTFVMTGGEISGNTATGNGGGVYMYAAATMRGTITATGGAITGNTAAGSGGGIYVPTAYLGAVLLELTDVEFDLNLAGSGATKLEDASLILLHGQVVTNCTSSLPADFSEYLFNNFDINYAGTDYYFAVRYWNNQDDPDSLHTMQLYLAGAAVTAPGTQPGHATLEFTGWHTDPAANAEYTFGSAMGTAHVDLYAGYGAAALRYTVTFHLRGGSGTAAPQQVAAGDYIPKPANPTMTGHSFVGWFENPNNLATEWDFGNDAMPANPVNLYAVYEVNSYTVVFDYGYGGITRQRSVPYGRPIPAPTDAAQSGYTLKGWAENGSMWSFNTTMPARVVRLTAVWEYTGGTSNGGGDGGEQSSSSSSSTGRVVPSSSAAVSSSGADSSSATATPSSVVAEPDEPTDDSPVAVIEETLPEDDGGRGTPGGDDYVEPAGYVTILGNDIPVGGLQSKGGYSMFNLLLAALMVLHGVLLSVSLLRQRRRLMGGMNDLESPSSMGLTGLLGWAAVALAGLSAVLYVTLESFRFGPIVFSRWTPLFIALTVVQIVLRIVVSVRRSAKAR